MLKMLVRAYLKVATQSLHAKCYSGFLDFASQILYYAFS